MHIYNIIILDIMISHIHSDNVWLTKREKLESTAAHGGSRHLLQRHIPCKWLARWVTLWDWMKQWTPKLDEIQFRRPNARWKWQMWLICVLKFVGEMITSTSIQTSESRVMKFGKMLQLLHFDLAELPIQNGGFIHFRIFRCKGYHHL